MPKFINVSPLGALDLPLLGRVVAPGEVIELTRAQARHLKGQADWKPVSAAHEAADGAQTDTTGAGGADTQDGAAR
ncbi:hypothetical protein [Sanguibacter sp. HDW7]|uniref:hypothetical protein n=1 Tax=Sanguibacter sp. HDW7 TaxID=2714931 RepID=UPI00140C7D25|nr:hypothetical protein [Sanguibacter sp. HDW7]QIK83109.1 hypothetical protein G7063_05305 [Sanguibacter sp. HDW7]